MGRAGALLAEIRPGDPAVLSWCDLDRAAVVVGRAAGPPPISWLACRQRGLTVHYRSSGGGVVLWDADLVAVDIVMPTGHPLLAQDVVQAYRWVGEALAAALKALGLSVELVDVEASRAADVDPLVRAACFGSLSPWEVTASGRKIVGLSQVRRREGGIIQVGVPLRVDVDLLAAVIDGPGTEMARPLDSAMVGIQSLEQSISRDDLIQEVGRALEKRLGAQAVSGVLTPSEQAVETRLATTKHAALSGPE